MQTEFIRWECLVLGGTQFSLQVSHILLVVESLAGLLDYSLLLLIGLRLLVVTVILLFNYSL